jgi:hypothetical protein
VNRHYEFAPGLALSLEGSGAVLRHFDAEYGRAGSTGLRGAADVEVSFEASVSNGPYCKLRGSHKTVSWDVALGSAESEPLRASIRLAGRPRSFGLSLVQGYIVEPLISIAAARRRLVLLPAAAFSDDGTALILMGRSRSGKSSLAVHALSAGRLLLGDDQVLLQEPRGCRPFPRRLRLYPDIRETAPAAHAALSRGSRLGLDVRRALDAVSRGNVRPPVRIQATELGLTARSPLPISGVALIERGGSGREVSAEPLRLSAAVEAGTALLAEQRAHLAVADDRNWSRALAAAADAEKERISEILEGVPAERLVLPATWDAARAISALADRFRLVTA